MADRYSLLDKMAEDEFGAAVDEIVKHALQLCGKNAVHASILLVDASVLGAIIHCDGKHAQASRAVREGLIPRLNGLAAAIDKLDSEPPATTH
jgi:hypothetical protein